LATKTFNLAITMPNTAPVGFKPLSINIELSPAEAKTLRQLRDGFIGTSTQTGGGVGKTLKLLLDQIATQLALQGP
jgi:hypothetical protein